MVKFIKTNNMNYFFDYSTNSKLRKYDPNNKNLGMVVTLDDGTILKVDGKNIHVQFGGQIYFDYMDDRYLISDGYRNILTSSGYIVVDNYNTKKWEGTASEGTIMRTNLMDSFYIALKDKFTILSNSPSSIVLFHETDKYNVTICLDTINSIVAKNQERKKSHVPCYSFDKSMDKYMTFYLSIFTEKKDNHIQVDPDERFKIIYNDIYAIKTYMSDMIKDHTFEHISNGKQVHRIYRWEGI